MTRKYELKRRAEKQAETRNRIVEATVALHTSIGPARTTIAAIAEAAGVQRHTVYSHFPDERQLFRACSRHWSSQHPFPDTTRWARIEDGGQRLRAALTDIYAWYEDVETELAVLRRDAAVHGITAELIESDDRELDSVRDRLASGWPRRRSVRAAIGHALQFDTWRSLTRRQGLSRAQAVDAMLRLVTSV